MIHQGVRQGGILPPFLYKLYVNNLLEDLKTHHNPPPFKLNGPSLTALVFKGWMVTRLLSVVVSYG
jgi:hypothetical protein